MKGQRPMILDAGDEGHPDAAFEGCCCGYCVFWQGGGSSGSYAGECHLMEGVESEVTDDEAWCERFESEQRLKVAMKDGEYRS